MKILKNKKGFTLIELLAVIAILAIVSVIATRTVFPYMANARKDAFATEANEIIGVTSDAMSLISLGEIRDNYTIEPTGTYCFTLENLRNLGLLVKDDEDYVGTVTVTVNGNAYSYAISMSNGTYNVDKSGQINADTDVNEGAGEDIKTACTTS